MLKMLGCGLVLLAALVGGALVWLYTPDEQRAALVAKYAGPPSVFLDVAGVRLHVRDTGPRTAPAVIFLHGFGSSLQTWEDWARDLEPDHRVIRYDIPGFGLTGPDPSGDYTDGRSIAVLIALMDRLGVARTSVVGNSMGGRIAWIFAALNPERTDAILRELSENTGQSAYLAALTGRDVVVADAVEPARATRIGNIQLGYADHSVRPP